MPSLKFVIRSKVINSDGTTNLKLRVCHKGVHAHLRTPWYIKPDELSSDGWIKSTVRGHTGRNRAMMNLWQEYNNIIDDIGPEVRNMPLKTLVSRLKANEGGGADIVKYAEKRISALRIEKRFSTADLYYYTIKCLKEYAARDNVLFAEIDLSFLQGFESHLRAAGASQNTVRNYMANIQQLFNRAIDADKIIKQQLYPFREYKIKGEKKKALALDVNDLRRLLYAKEYLTRAQQREVNTFFLIFYLGGINYKDLLFLKREDYYKGRIYYTRFKTGREYSIPVYPEAEEIIESYKGEKYLLKFVEDKIAITEQRREAFINKDLLKNCNKLLKLAGEQCGIKLRLKTYVARYSFATVASKIGISKDTIRHILGHGLNTMTDLYIDFDQEKADKAIREVIDRLKNKPMG
jgi:integrase